MAAILSGPQCVKFKLPLACVLWPIELMYIVLLPAAHHWSGFPTPGQPALPQESSGRLLPPGSSERFPRRHAGELLSLIWSRAANQYGISVFCTDFTCKIREYEFGLENTEIELCQFCHFKYCCQNKAYLFWVANQSGFVAFYALEPSNTFLITKTFNLLSSTCSSSMLSCLTSCSCSTGSIH